MQTGFVAAALLLAFAAADSRRYDVPMADATRGLLRQVPLAVVRGAVWVYDPSTPRFLPTGPDAPPDSAEYVAVDRAFAPGGAVRVEEVHSGRVVVPDFRFQPSDEPRLAELRRKYRLDDVVAPAADEFGAMVLLRNWARSQFRRGDYQPLMANFDALEVLDRGLRDHGEPYAPGRHYDPCHFFPLFYCQLALALGHQSRLMSFGHGHAEVWSNQFDKWVLMDVELNHHYEKDGVPLSMVDLLDENYAPGPTRARLVRGEQSSGDANTTMVHLKVPELDPARTVTRFNTHLTLVDRRNDWMTNHYFRGHPARSEANSLVYADPRLNRPLGYADRMRPVTHDRADLYWPLNRTEVLARRPSGGAVDLVLRTFAPNFSHFEVAVDGTTAARVTDGQYRWKFHPGANDISIRAVNRLGVRGPESRVRLSVAAEGN